MNEKNPLYRLIDDRSIEEIIVHNPRSVWITKKRKIYQTPITLSNEEINQFVNEKVTESGKSFSEETPVYDFHMTDGSRMLAMKSNHSFSITINKFSSSKLNAHDLIDYGTMTKEAYDFIRRAVESKCNILISGGTGSGKTTLLNVLADMIPDEEKVVSLEDSRELQLDRTHYVPLEFRNEESDYKDPTIEGVGKLVGFVFSRDIPDRILFGEFREAGALETILGLQYTDKSIMATIHANNYVGALERLNEVAAKSSFHYDEQEFKHAVAEQLDLVIQIHRLKNGNRMITEIMQVDSYDSSTNTFSLIPLFLLNVEEGSFQLIRTENDLTDKVKNKLKSDE